MLKKNEDLILPDDSETEIGDLYEKVCRILEVPRERVSSSVNSEMVYAYWHIGLAIIEQEQAGNERADYGKRLIQGLSERLKADGRKGFSKSNLWYMRQFYLAYFEKLHALLRGELCWTHYRLLLKVEKQAAREFYETEAISEGSETLSFIAKQDGNYKLEISGFDEKTEKV